MNKLWLRSKEELFTHFEVTKSGLNSTEVEGRIQKYGENKIVQGSRKGVLTVFLEQFKDLLVIILIVAAFVSSITGGIEGAIVIVVVLLLNAVLGTVQHFKAQQSMDSLKQMASPNARVLRDGRTMQIPASNLVPGDLLLLEAGDMAAGDGRIIENYSLQVDESALTGESTVVVKQIDEILEDEVALGDRLNMVYSGSLITYGRAVVVVTSTGMNTEIGKIATLMKNTSEKITPLQRNLDDFSKKLSFLIIGICIVIFGLGVYRGQSLSESLLFAIALAVAAIPEALSSIVTIALAIGTQKMADQHAIIKNLRAVESLGSVSVICSDKTGTLTQNKMTVEHIYTTSGLQDTDEINQDRIDLMMYASLCNDGSIHEGKVVGDPTETALLEYYNKHLGNYQDIQKLYPRIFELPFDSQRKTMSTLHTINQQQIMVIKGAPDVLLARCSHKQVQGKIQPMDQETIQHIENQNTIFSSQGLRVLAITYKVLNNQQVLTIEDEDQVVFLGLFALIDPPRVESMQAVEDCKRAGIKPVMITGDHKVTACAIASKIGIFEAGDNAIEGIEIEKMSDEELQQQVQNISVYARVAPVHKIRIVKAWQSLGHIVAMTGDGVNDAPALKEANIGVAMGITGTDVSKDAAMMILTDDNFSTIIKAVENGRNVYANIKNSIQFLLSGNLAAIITVLITSILGLPVPFSAVQLLFINLLTDSLPALAINMEPSSKDVLKQKPRDPSESIMTMEYLKQIGIQGGLLSVVVLFAYYIGLQSDPVLASTMAFATLCGARLFHGFNCRSNKAVTQIPSNKYSVVAFLLGMSFLLVVLFVTPLHGLFNIASSMNSTHVFMIVGLAFIPTLGIQIQRIIRYKSRS